MEKFEFYLEDFIYSNLMSTKLIGQHYEVYFNKVLGEGSFGKVYLCIDTNTHKFYAVKTEEKKNKLCLLEMESNIIKHVHQQKTTEPIINCYWYGVDEKFNYVVTDLLGPSLGTLHKSYGNFSLKTTLMIGEQLINRIKFYHDHDVIHRDIKPNNILIEYNRPQQNLYLIDFGLAKKYRINKTHIPYSDSVNRVGTARYMSVNAHKKHELSRKDDMYSIGYVLLYFILGKLPWQGLHQIKGKKINDQICKVKNNTSNTELTAKIGCDNCKESSKVCSAQNVFKNYFDYLDSLRFDSDINYNYILKLLLTCMEDHQYCYDYKWDWYRDRGTKVPL